MQIKLSPEEADMLMTIIDFTIREIDNATKIFPLDTLLRQLCKRRILEFKSKMNKELK